MNLLYEGTEKIKVKTASWEMVKQQLDEELLKVEMQMRAKIDGDFAEFAKKLQAINDGPKWLIHLK